MCAPCACTACVTWRCGCTSCRHDNLPANGLSQPTMFGANPPVTISPAPAAGIAHHAQIPAAAQAVGGGCGSVEGEGVQRERAEFMRLVQVAHGRRIACRAEGD